MSAPSNDANVSVLRSCVVGRFVARCSPPPTVCGRCVSGSLGGWAGGTMRLGARRLSAAEHVLAPVSPRRHGGM